MRRRLGLLLSALGKQPVRSHAHSHGDGGWCGAHHHNHSHTHQVLDDATKERYLRQCQLVTVVGGTTNIIFCSLKIWFGSSGGSVALIADGFHALVDLLADVISYASLTLSMKRLPRCRFPFGIGRIETAGAVVISLILLLGGLTLLFQSLRECWWEAFHRINHHHHDPALSSDHSPECQQQHHHHHQASNTGHDDHHGHSHFQVTKMDNSGHVTVLWAMVLVSVFSIIGKELLYRWTKRVGEQAGSRVVVANAYHHRADAWSGAVALVGVAGHCVGMPGIDGLAGLCVSCSICRMGFRVVRSSLLEFFDFQCANEVSTVRRVLQQQCSKVPLVNIFLIRHGHSYTLHVTLLVGAHTTAVELASITKELTALTKKEVSVTETYTTLFVCDKEKEASIQDAVRVVVEFHGLHPITCDWGAKQLLIHHPMHNECMDDIRTVAAVFEFQIVVVDNA